MYMHTLQAFVFIVRSVEIKGGWRGGGGRGKAHDITLEPCQPF